MFSFADKLARAHLLSRAPVNDNVEDGVEHLPGNVHSVTFDLFRILSASSLSLQSIFENQKPGPQQEGALS